MALVRVNMSINSLNHFSMNEDTGRQRLFHRQHPPIISYESPKRENIYKPYKHETLLKIPDFSFVIQDIQINLNIGLLLGLYTQKIQLY